MFQILTLVKRLDATEVAMNKMATMIEDLAKGQSSLADATPKGISVLKIIKLDYNHFVITQKENCHSKSTQRSWLLNLKNLDGR